MEISKDLDAAEIIRRCEAAINDTQSSRVQHRVGDALAMHSLARYAEIPEEQKMISALSMFLENGDEDALALQVWPLRRAIFRGVRAKRMRKKEFSE